jgi:DNA-binding MarR family transcriptional regulator
VDSRLSRLASRHDDVMSSDPTPPPNPWLATSHERAEAAFAALLAGPVVAAPADEGTTPADLPLLLRLANARVETLISQATRDTGYTLTPAAVHVLRHCRYAGKPVASLAEHLHVSRQAAFQVVNRLVAAGLAERTPGTHGPLVELTDEGTDVVREVTAILTQVMETWLVQVGEDRLTQLCADLELMAEPPGARWRGLSR